MFLVQPSDLNKYKLGLLVWIFRSYEFRGKKLIQSQSFKGGLKVVTCIYKEKY